MEPNGRRHHGRVEARLIPAARQLPKQLNGPLMTISGAVIGFDGFKGGERGMHSQYYHCTFLDQFIEEGV
jgi:hypothetical protein